MVGERRQGACAVRTLSGCLRGLLKRLAYAISRRQRPSCYAGPARLSGLRLQPISRTAIRTGWTRWTG